MQEISTNASMLIGVGHHWLVFVTISTGENHIVKLSCWLLYILETSFFWLLF